MKRASGHITRSPSGSPPPPPFADSTPLSRSAAFSATKTPVSGIEHLRFRERDGKPSAYTRLYAQGVDQLAHKDQVYQQYGLHKSPLAPSLLTPKSKLASSGGATGFASHTAQSSNSGSAVYGISKGISHHHRSVGSTNPQASTRVHGPSLLSKGRAVMPRHQRSSGGNFLSTSSDRKTSQHNRQFSNAPSTAASSRPSGKPQRRQSAIATQLLSKTLKVGPAVIHSVSSSTMASYALASSSASLQRRPSVAPTGVPTSSSQLQTQRGVKPLSRRKSFQIGAMTPRPLTRSPLPQSVGMPLFKDSPGHPVDVQLTAAVLVPVSRRTSSSIVAPNVSDFGGMQRRPSVSPIRAGNPSSGSLNTLDESYTGAGAVARPSVVLMRRDSKMDRLVEQITVLKNSLGLTDEDLQWKVESTKGNAYEAAARHQNEAEELYDRLLYEIQLLSETPCDEASAALVKRLIQLIKKNNLVAELKPKLAACQTDVMRRKQELKESRIACELLLAKSGESAVDGANRAQDDDGSMTLAQQQLDVAKQLMIQMQTQMTDEMTRLNELLVTLGKETDTLAAACARFKFLSPDAAEVNAAFLTVLRCIPECVGDKLVALCEQGVQTAQRFAGSKAKELKRKESEMEKAMRDIEVWKARKEQSKEYAMEMAKRERQWREAQREANLESLRLLRSLVPQDIQQITVDALIERARETGEGVLYTYDLALYIKQNRLLHWLVTHESDIVRDNFLAVECVSHFANFASYDIHELRAVCEVLPEAFEFDKEGKKADWKRQFMDHVRTLIKQQRGGTIKAGWDPSRGTRAEVPLKPLSDKQLLNTVYRYPTDEEIQSRIDRFELQLKRLAQKQARRDKLDNEEIPTAKSEYLAIAEDARSEELQQTFGKATLIKLRDEAKQTFQTLCKTRDALKSEIDHSERQWSTQTPSYDQFLAEAAKIRALTPETRAARIPGPFSGEIELKPRARAAFKKLSVEEEAEARRNELSKAIADRDKGLADDIVATAAAAATATANAAAVAAATESTIVDAKSAEVVATENFSERSAQNGSNEMVLPSGSERQFTTEAMTTGDSQPQPSAPVVENDAIRCVKSLRVSAEVLRFLQNDFCSPQRTKRNTTLPVAEIFGSPPPKKAPFLTPATSDQVHVQRRSSLPKTSDVTAPEAEGNRPRSSTLSAIPKLAAPLGPPKPKSKALLALLQKQELAAAAATAAGAIPSENTWANTAAKPTMKLDFLNELKRKAVTSNKPENAPDAPSLFGRANLAAPLNFLSELKRRANKTPEAGIQPSDGCGSYRIENTLNSSESPKKMSFLDELALIAKKTSLSSDKTPTAANEPASNTKSLPPPPPAMFALSTAHADAAPRSFLDELKAKAWKKSAAALD